MRFRLLPTGLEEVMFKQIPEGWLFTTVSPWLFARRRTYIVSDAQKPAIAKRVRRGRYIRVILSLLFAPLTVLAIIEDPSLMNTHAPRAWVMFGLLSLAFVVLISVSDYLNIQPLLRNVPRTTQKIRTSDMLKTQSRALSVRALAMFTALFAVGAIVNIGAAYMDGDAFVGVSGAILTVFTLVGGWTLVAKPRAKPAALDIRSTAKI
jgi:hypothetical protein